jgi:hypothetical protein
VIQAHFKSLWLLTSLIALPQCAVSREANDGQLTLSDVRIEGLPLTLEAEVPGTFTIPFRVVNNSPYTIVLEEFHVRFLVSPGVFVQKYIAPEAESEASPQTARAATGIVVCEMEQGAIAPGSTRFAYCEFQSIVQLESFTDVFTMAGNWRTLTLTPAQFQVFSAARFATYSAGSDDKSLHSISLVTPINLRPTIWQVIAGAFLGALLLALFIMTRSTEQSHYTSLSRFKFWLNRTFRFSILFVSGWLSASIVIFITYRMHDSGFPISLSISDFYGGVVVGLFGYVAASWIQEKILPLEGESEQRSES